MHAAMADTADAWRGCVVAGNYLNHISLTGVFQTPRAPPPRGRAGLRLQPHSHPLTCVMKEVGMCGVHALLQPEGVVDWQLTHRPLCATANLHGQSNMYV